MEAIFEGYKGNLNFSFIYFFSGEKKYSGGFAGVLKYVKRRHTDSRSHRMRDNIDEYVEEIPCPECHGARLKDSALAVRVGGLNIYEFTEFP